MNIIEAAQDFATLKHGAQTRKNSKEPYVEHPKRVAQTLKEAGFRDEVIAAGLLHDVVEDTPVTIEDIKEKFGEDVAEIVASHTEDKSLSWEERKKHTISVVKTAPLEVKALIVADKLDNLQSLKQQYEEMGEEVWKAFKRGKEQQAWYNRSVAEAIHDESDVPAFFHQYEQLVADFFK
ncbi:HD domain-containing protein [Bacillus massiliigorillae]|uniref:HD domain-containing protein n=1 Tax=Bacillus massiliigorillae TaxID=1243664 RepID=UPI0003A1C00E|nr:HD domain-containing protein [Bacillus massiliigorillae]